MNDLTFPFYSVLNFYFQTKDYSVLTKLPVRKIVNKTSEFIVIKFRINIKKLMIMDLKFKGITLPHSPGTHSASAGTSSSSSPPASSSPSGLSSLLLIWTLHPHELPAEDWAGSQSWIFWSRFLSSSWTGQFQKRKV